MPRQCRCLAPGLLSCTSNAHHHPPEAALGRAGAIAPGRVNDDVRRLKLYTRLIGERNASNELIGSRNSLRHHLASNQRRLQSRSTCHEKIGIHLKMYHAQVADKRCVLYLDQKLGRCLFFLFACPQSNLPRSSHYTLLS